MGLSRYFNRSLHADAEECLNINDNWKSSLLNFGPSSSFLCRILTNSVRILSVFDRLFGSFVHFSNTSRNIYTEHTLPRYGVKSSFLLRNCFHFPIDFSFFVGNLNTGYLSWALFSEGLLYPELHKGANHVYIISNIFFFFLLHNISTVFSKITLVKN